jgi:hypothetical protein
MFSHVAPFTVNLLMHIKPYARRQIC